MKKMLCAFAMACLSVSAVSAQQTSSENPPTVAQTTFFAELGGPGVLFSTNIDRRFSKSNLGLGARIGVGFFTDDYVEVAPDDYRQKSILTIPVQINYVFGKSNSPHTFEIGGGATVLSKKNTLMNFDEGNGPSVLGSASFMYRRQPRDGGFTWRIGYTPLFAQGYIQFSAGVSVGYAF